MNSRIRTIILGVIFAAVAIWGYSIFFGGSKRATVHTGNAAPPPGDYVAAQQAPIQQRHLDSAAVAHLRDAAWGRDPFYHTYTVPKNHSPETGGLHLSGILYRDVNARAMINRTVVAVGDKVDQYTVAEITRDFVRLTKDGASIRLTVSKESS